MKEEELKNEGQEENEKEIGLAEEDEGENREPVDDEDY
jgi:hypothetical protein